MTTTSVEDASWSNTIGATELIEVWTDPEFDPDLAATASISSILLTAKTTFIRALQ